MNTKIITGINVPDFSFQFPWKKDLKFYDFLERGSVLLIIVKVAGRGLSPKMRMPKWMAVLSGYGYQALALLTAKPPITSTSWVRVGSHYSWWDCSKARKELGLKPTPVEKSIGRAVEWFSRYNYI